MQKLPSRQSSGLPPQQKLRTAERATATRGSKRNEGAVTKQPYTCDRKTQDCRTFLLSSFRERSAFNIYIYIYSGIVIPRPFKCLTKHLKSTHK